MKVKTTFLNEIIDKLLNYGISIKAISNITNLEIDTIRGIRTN